ncbi:MAG TPA: chorismate mutase, partial [Burkholderiaceae bacterium]|nr:chorismate mutase [Burkholderiaceae bacterium]
MAEAATNPQLQALRDRIDAIDRELLGALNRRATLAQQVGELKKHEGSVVFRPEREAQVIDGLKSANSGPLAGDSIAPIWREIMSACRALETPTRVAYLGPAGTFSEEAALGYFGNSIVRVPCVNFDEVVRATSAGAADFGVVPVENNTEGVVARSLDLFLTMPLFIIGETSLLVRHNLLRMENSRHGIAAVLAHPQALAQCHGWLSLNLPDVERRPVTSNAEGARLAAHDPALAAIASTRAAGEFGLHVVAPAIQDEAHNRTRFAILTHPERHPAPRPSGHDCTSLVLSVPNKPGAV